MEGCHKPEAIPRIGGISMIIEFVRRSFPVVVDMAGSPPIVIERASEVAMKVYLKAKEM